MALDQSFYECHTGDSEGGADRHCVLSKDNSHNFNDPEDLEGLTSHVKRTEKEECFDYITDQLTRDFSQGQVPWQCLL